MGMNLPPIQKLPGQEVPTSPPPPRKRVSRGEFDDLDKKKTATNDDDDASLIPWLIAILLF